MQNTYDKLLEETKAKILATVDLKPENHWTLDTNKDGYVVYTKENPENGLRINRTETNAQVDPELFISLVIDMTRKKEYDPNFLEVIYHFNFRVP
jgi:steroidogenic acute regulatory protein